MKLRDAYPELCNFSSDALIRKVDPGTLSACLTDIGDAYSLALPMWRVLVHYGEYANQDDSGRSVRCLWSTHGTEDKNRSAKYFASDRNTGQERGAVYCYKCQKSLTSFWYVHQMMKDQGLTALADTIKFVEVTFGVPFPRDVLLDFDPDVFFSFESASKTSGAMRLAFDKARKLRELKTVDQAAYVQSLLALYTEATG